jgi:Enolase, C-terminal TIM barrel domain
VTGSPKTIWSMSPCRFHGFRGVLCFGITPIAASSAKYNRLLEIERELGSKARYAGASMYERWKHSVKA